VESVEARRIGAAAFPADAAVETATVVFFREGGLSAADTAYRDAFAAWLIDPATPATVCDHVLGVTTVATSPLRAPEMQSEDGTTELASVRLDVVVISRYREELARTSDGGRSAASRAIAAERTVARTGAVIAASAAPSSSGSSPPWSRRRASSSPARSDR
jgi:hypothetical protein